MFRELFLSRRAPRALRRRRRRGPFEGTKREDTHPTLTPSCFWYAFSVCGRRTEEGGVSVGASRERRVGGGSTRQILIAQKNKKRKNTGSDLPPRSSPQQPRRRRRRRHAPGAEARNVSSDGITHLFSRHGACLQQACNGKRASSLSHRGF